MKYTDENIPVECAECEAMCEGFKDILSHILEVHGDIYSQEEAANSAQLWVEDAYPLREQEMADYYDGRKLDKAIEADTFPNK